MSTILQSLRLRAAETLLGRRIDTDTPRSDAKFRLDATVEMACAVLHANASHEPDAMGHGQLVVELEPEMGEVSVTIFAKSGTRIADIYLTLEASRKLAGLLHSPIVLV